MRLSLRGAQGPFFIRNIVLLTDSRGRQGLGETAGGTEVGQLLESVRPLIENSLIAQYKNTLQKAGHCLRKRARHCLPARGKAPDTLAGAVLVALEAALLDLSLIHISCKKALKKAFQLQLDGKGLSFVEVLSPCPTGWSKKPVDALKWLEEQMIPIYPLGVFKDAEEVACQ